MLIIKISNKASHNTTSDRMLHRAQLHPERLGYRLIVLLLLGPKLFLIQLVALLIHIQTPRTIHRQLEQLVEQLLIRERLLVLFVQLTLDLNTHRKIRISRLVVLQIIISHPDEIVRPRGVLILNLIQPFIHAHLEQIVLQRFSVVIQREIRNADHFKRSHDQKVIDVEHFRAYLKRTQKVLERIAKLFHAKQSQAYIIERDAFVLRICFVQPIDHF